MLVIDYDITDAYITTPAFTVVDGPLNLPKSQSGSQYNEISLTPDLTAALITPLQALDTWPSQTKMQLSEWLADPSKWEQQQVRATNDWFLHSRGQVAAPISTKYGFGRNVGFMLEIWPYAAAKSSVYPLCDITFGVYFTLYLHSDGTAELWDSRLAAAQQAMGTQPAPVATGSIATQDITGKFLRLVIQPCRRGQILISSNLGGFFWANVGAFIDTKSKDADPSQNGLNVITESGPVTLYQVTQPVSAFFSLTPLMYPAQGSWQSANLTTPYPMTAAPQQTMLADQEFGSSIVLTLSKTPSNGNPVSQFAYTLVFTSGKGLAPYSGGESPAFVGNFYSPYDYYNKIKSERQLGPNQYQTNTIYNPIQARLTRSKERNEETFEFTLDNPHALWTSLKDLENRKIHVYLSTPELEGLAPNTEFNSTSDPDPDEGLIAANGNQPVDVFFGYGDIVDFEDGLASQVNIRCVGLRKKLQKFMLSDAEPDDGRAHTTVVHDILKACGYTTPEEATDSNPALMYIYPDDTPLPSAGPGTEPLFRPVNGQSADEYLRLIQNFSGWQLSAVNGVWYYVPLSYFTVGGVFTEGIPQISQDSQVSSPGRLFQAGTNSFGQITNLQLPDAIYPNPPTLTMLADPKPRQSSREIVANDIWVIGMTDDGEPLAANYVDQDSISNRTATNYVGDRWRFIFISAAINTLAAAKTVCAVLAANLTVPQDQLEFALPDWRPELPVDTAVNPDGYPISLISGIDADLSIDRYRKTNYVADLNPTIF